MIKKIFSTVFLVFSMGYAFCEQTDGLMALKDAVLLALRQNPAMQSQALDKVLQKYQWLMAEREFEPQTSLQSSMGYSYVKLDGTVTHTRTRSASLQTQYKLPWGASAQVDVHHEDSDGHFHPSLELSLKQPLLRGFGVETTQASLHDAHDSNKQQTLSFRDETVSTIQTVIHQYRAIVQAKHQWTIQKMALKGALQNEQDNALKIKAGIMARADNTQVKADVARQQLAVMEAEQALQSTRRTLLMTLGLPPNAPLKVDETVKVPVLEIPSVEVLQKQVLAYHGGYQRLLIQHRMLKRALVVARNQTRWGLDVQLHTHLGGAGSGETGFSSWIHGRDVSHTASINLSVPIESLPNRKAILDAQTALQKNEIALKKMKADIESQVIEQRQKLLSQTQRIHLAETSVTLSKEVLEHALKKLSYGRVGQFEVSTDRQNFNTQSLALLNEKISYLNQLTDFYAFNGSLLSHWGLSKKGDITP